jgi:hypothetical protein
VKTWVDLYRGHAAVRACVGRAWTSEVRKRLISLATAGHCDGTIRGRFSNQTREGLDEWSIRRDGRQASEPLHKLPGLRSADLTVLGLIGRADHLHTFTVMVAAMRNDGSRWSLAVHLPDDRVTVATPGGDRQGHGACGHAAVHCHVGPDLDTVPKVRVPLPVLGPVDILDWVMSQLLPTADFEPAPWAEVQAALKKAPA